MASELDAVERLAPDFFRALMDDLDSRLTKSLRSLAPDGQKWLAP